MQTHLLLPGHTGALAKARPEPLPREVGRAARCIGASAFREREALDGGDRAAEAR